MDISWTTLPSALRLKTFITRITRGNSFTLTSYIFVIWPVDSPRRGRWCIWGLRTFAPVVGRTSTQYHEVWRELKPIGTVCDAEFHVCSPLSPLLSRPWCRGTKNCWTQLSARRRIQSIRGSSSEATWNGRKLRFKSLPAQITNTASKIRLCRSQVYILYKYKTISRVRREIFW
jgi:hypothetical protein